MSIRLESLAGDEGQKFVSDFENIIPDGVRDSFRDIEGVGEAVGFPALVEEIMSAFTNRGGEIGIFFLFVFGIVALMSVGSAITGRLSRAAECAVMIISSAAIFSRLQLIVTEITDTVGGVLSFFSAFIPIMTGVVAYAGGVGSATVGGVGANMTLGVLGSFVIPALNSCVSVIFALGLVGAAGHEGTSGLAKRVRSFFMWLVGICTMLLLTSLALQSAIASSADTAAMRAVKYAASGAIPIVGGSVSSAMGALAAGVSYIKGAVGIGAVGVILLLTLTPLVMLLVYRFALSLAEGVLDFLGVSFGARMFSSFRAALDVLIAVLALSVSVLIIEITLFMKSGVSAF